MSRSVAGSYDNEGVSIFALVFCFYMFLKSVNTVSRNNYFFLCFFVGVYYVVNILCSLLFLYGFCLGRICFYYQYYSYFCAILIHFRKIFITIICFLLYFLYYGNILCYVNPFCWILSLAFK